MTKTHTWVFLAIVATSLSSFAVNHDRSEGCASWQRLHWSSAEISRVFLGAAPKIAALEKSGELCPVEVSKIRTKNGKIYKLTGVVVNETDIKDFTMIIKPTYYNESFDTLTTYDIQYHELPINFSAVPATS